MRRTSAPDRAHQSALLARPSSAAAAGSTSGGPHTRCSSWACAEHARPRRAPSRCTCRRPAVTDRPCRAVPRRRTPCHPLWSHRVALVHRDASCARAPLAQARMLGKARHSRARHGKHKPLSRTHNRDLRRCVAGGREALAEATTERSRTMARGTARASRARLGCAAPSRRQTQRTACAVGVAQREHPASICVAGCFAARSGVACSTVHRERWALQVGASGRGLRGRGLSGRG